MQKLCIFLTKKAPENSEAFILLVIAEGFEPSTVCLEGRCSIQLSYATLHGVLLKNNVPFK